MITGYTFELEPSSLYCPPCNQVEIHLRQAANHPWQESESQNKHRVLCICKKCAAKKILFFTDFPEYSEEPSLTFKIPHLSRLAVRDKVFLPEFSQRGIVASRFRIGDKETFTFELENGEKAEMLLPPIPRETMPLEKKFLLFPSQTDSGRVGDAVFDEELNLPGTLVGIVHAPLKIFFIQLENGNIKEVTSKSPDKTFVSIKLPWLNIALEEAEKFHIRNFRASFESGVLTLQGESESLEQALEFAEKTERHPQVLAVLNEISINPPHPLADNLLATLIRQKLLSCTHGLELFDIRLQIRNGHVSLWAKSRQPLPYRALEKNLGCIAGLKGLNSSIATCLAPTSIEKSNELKVASALRRFGPWKNTALNIFATEGKVYLEGLVFSRWQKTFAQAIAWCAARPLSLINNLSLPTKESL